MTKSYQVLGSNGKAQAGTGVAAATAWRSQLRPLLAASQPVAMPYADPDVVALHRAGLDLDVTRSVTSAASRAATATGTAMYGTLAYLPRGRIDAGSLDLLHSAGVRTVLLSASAMPTTSSSDITLDGVAPVTDDGSTKAVLSDPGITAALAMPTDNPGDALLARQRLLAEVAATTLEDPSSARTIVAAPDAQWDPDAATASAWLSALSTVRGCARRA